VVGLSILSGSHLDLVPETIRLLRDDGVDAPVVVGGIIPEADQPRLLAAGVARIYTPKDFRLADIMADLADLALSRRESAGSGETSGASSSAAGSDRPMKRP
jgi:(2R)-ethylmalonyl-CoA mutase